MAGKTIGAIENIECNQCGMMIKHTLRGSYDAYWHEETIDIHASAEYELLECNGCQTGTLRITEWCSEAPEDHSVEYWPPRKSDLDHREPKQFTNMPYGSDLESVYRQTVTASNNKLPTLAAAGVRFVIEGICLDLGIIEGKNYTNQGKVVRNRTTNEILRRKNLEGKINGLWEKGRISKEERKLLHELRRFGNESAHELNNPSMKLEPIPKPL